MEMNSVMHNDLKEVLLTEEDIQNICKELGAQLTKDYQTISMRGYLKRLSNVYVRFN